MPISGYTSDLPSDILLDSGVLYVGTSVRGVSRGGLSFDPGKSWNNIEFDGKRSDVLGLHRVTKFEPVISGTMLEFDSAELVEYEPGLTSAGTGTVVYTMKDAGTLLASGDYMTDVRLVFERGAQSGAYAAVHFPKALVRKWSVKGVDNDVAEIAVEIVAVLDMSGGQLTDCPYKIELRATLPT